MALVARAMGTKPQSLVNNFFAEEFARPNVVATDSLVRAYVDYAIGTSGSGPAGLSEPAVDICSGEYSPPLIHFTKRLFNYYFRNDLYGEHRSTMPLVLSSGSPHEPTFSLPAALKRCIGIALDRDWYGYSDSRGRSNARSAVARLANGRIGSEVYTSGSVAVTMGGTFGVSCVVDYLATALPPGTAICAVPNYPPLVETVSRRMPVRLARTEPCDGFTAIDELIDSLTDDTRVVLLQSVTNPTGLPVSEDDLERLINAMGEQTYLILDEAHECFGAAVRPTPMRAHPRVIRVFSLSKQLSIPGMKVGWILTSPDFVDDFYEYASTTYGGPPSFFYTLIDVFASFEHIRLDGTPAGRWETLRGIAERYDLSYLESERWCARYLAETTARDEGLLRQREFALDLLGSAGVTMIAPKYSINCSLQPANCHSSYGYFREAFDRTGVSVYPNILAFDLSDSSVRITLGRNFEELRAGLKRLTTLTMEGR